AQSRVEAALQLLGPELMDFFATGHAAQRQGNDHPEMFPHDCYPCAEDPSSFVAGERGSANSPETLSHTHSEDRWVAIAVRDDHDFDALANLIGPPPRASHPHLPRTAAPRPPPAQIAAPPP